MAFKNDLRSCGSVSISVIYKEKEFRTPLPECRGRHLWRQSLRASRVAAIGYAALKDEGRYAYLRAMWPCAAVTHEKNTAPLESTVTFGLSLQHVAPHLFPFTCLPSISP